jgi:cardiolipin synthase
VITAVFATLATLFHVGGIICALNAAGRSHTAEGAAAWVLGLVFMPYLALPAYAVFGPPDMERMAAARRPARRIALERIGKVPLPRDTDPSPEAEFRRAPLEALAPLPVLAAPKPELLTDMNRAFDMMFDAIDDAKETVFVQFYIVRDDGLGRRLKDRLIAKARQGVAVYVLYDRIGSHNAPSRYWREMEEAGVEVFPFEVIRGLGRFLRLNFRNHRKMVVADGRVAIIGGPNVGDEYLGLDPSFGAWRDTAMKLTGAAAAAAEACFLEDWVLAGGALPETPSAHCEAPAEGEGAPTLILPTGPADRLPACTLALVHLASAARERLWIATPYFVPDLDILTALKLAALRGVDVRILIPDKPDHAIVWFAAFAYADEALSSGIKLYRYTEGFMHQKAWVVDGWAAAIGTVNLDSRSLRLNFEVTGLVFDTAFTAEVAAMLEADFERSFRYDADAHAKRPLRVKILAPAARLAGPVL